MSRSIKKYYFVDPKLMDKIVRVKKENNNNPIKTWSRRSIITPDFVGLNFQVHNGRDFISVHVTENMVGHKLGEFSPTRSIKPHEPREGAKRK